MTEHPKICRNCESDGVLDICFEQHYDYCPYCSKELEMRNNDKT